MLRIGVNRMCPVSYLRIASSILPYRRAISSISASVKPEYRYSATSVAHLSTVAFASTPLSVRRILSSLPSGTAVTSPMSVS